jgi:hypothetical protein
MGTRFSSECAQLLGFLTRMSFPINCRQLAIDIRAIPDELLHERSLVGRVLSRGRVVDTSREQDQRRARNP